MKEKPIAIIIMLLGGAVSSICCLLTGAGLLFTLCAVFLSLCVFLIIGLIANKVITEITDEVREKDKLEKQIETDEEFASGQESDGEADMSDIDEISDSSDISELSNMEGNA